MPAGKFDPSVLLPAAKVSAAGGGAAFTPFLAELWWLPLKWRSFFLLYCDVSDLVVHFMKGIPLFYVCIGNRKLLGFCAKTFFHNAVFVYTFSVLDMVMRPYPGVVHMN